MKQLQNIATGFIVDHVMNVNDAINLGQHIHKQMTNKRYGEIVLKKAEQAVTFGVMKEAAKLEDGKICMSST